MAMFPFGTSPSNCSLDLVSRAIWVCSICIIFTKREKRVAEGDPSCDDIASKKKSTRQHHFLWQGSYLCFLTTYL